MNDYIAKFNQLKKECEDNFESDEGDDDEYVRVRVDVLDLFFKAKQELSGEVLTEISESIISFLCENCGSQLDIDILSRSTPKVLSEEDFEYIKNNSALARWF